MKQEFKLVQLIKTPLCKQEGESFGMGISREHECNPKKKLAWKKT